MKEWKHEDSSHIGGIEIGDAMKQAAILGLVLMSGCSSISDLDLSGLPALLDPETKQVITNKVETAPTVDAIPLSECKFFEANKDHILTFSLTVTVKSVTVGRYLTWETEQKLPWKDIDGCNGCIWLFLKRDGKWLASPGDQIRTGQAYKDRSDFKIYIGDGVVLRPEPDEECGFMLSTICRHSVYPNGTERSNTVLLKWPK